MHYSKKLFISLSFAIATILTLVGCSDDKGASNANGAYLNCGANQIGYGSTCYQTCNPYQYGGQPMQGYALINGACQYVGNSNYGGGGNVNPNDQCSMYYPGTVNTQYGCLYTCNNRNDYVYFNFQCVPLSQVNGNQNTQCGANQNYVPGYGCYPGY